MATTETWPEYLRRVTGGASGAEIARKTGISASTVSRWLSGETKPGTDKLTELAKHYPFQISEAVDVVAAYQPPRGPQYVLDSNLVRVILKADATRQAIIGMYSDLELAQELVRRIEEHASVEVGEPLPLADIAVAASSGFLGNLSALPGLHGVGGPAEDHLQRAARPAETEPTDEQ